MKKRNRNPNINLVLMTALITVLLFSGQMLQAKESGGTQLTIAVKAEPDSLVPSDSRFATTCYPISNNVFDRIVNLTPDGKFVPGVASWEVQNGGKEFLFTIKKGITFHSGDPLTAEDIKFSHERHWAKSPTYKRYMRTFEKIEVLDQYRIKFYFKKPNVLFIPMRATHVESKTYFERVGEQQFLEKPVGTGPYKFVTWKRGEFIEFERNDDYWGKKPQVQSVKFRFIGEDTTRAAALKTGEADMIMDTPWTLVKEVEDSGFKTIRLSAHPPCSVQFHNNNPAVPWYKQKVRLAIALAIDKDAIVNDLFHGIPSAYPRLGSWELGYDPEIKQYPFDPKRAKQLLSEAGYPKGFEMPLYYLAGRSYGQKETAEAVALFLNAIGIKSKISGVEGAQFLAKIRAWHSEPDTEYVGISTVPMAFNAEPMEALSSAYHSAGWGAMYFNKEELDPVIDQAMVTMEDKKRGELIKKAIKILHDDVATVQIWANTSVYAMKKNIEFTPTLKNREPLMLVKDVRVK